MSIPDHADGVEAPASESDMWDIAGLVDGQGPIGTCGCGLPVTEYEGQVVHVFNDFLMGTDDHDPDQD
ncbi:hypothetical protein GT755_12365 [Herbidospora sp. NEAU-GS84]|uniref:Uncharacterized protein n=1 Tax=Herbidospora solisilvae TaxID=2696284 RepID=A0A7C9NMV8_9ACTN|nr:hypothetical protein [Herbidospora solisilvae]NAS22476.1 hypothetical protein [Herbidospora solisilvae]